MEDVADEYDSNVSTTSDSEGDSDDSGAREKKKKKKEKKEKKKERREKSSSSSVSVDFFQGKKLYSETNKFLFGITKLKKYHSHRQNPKKRRIKMITHQNVRPPRLCCGLTRPVKKSKRTIQA